MFDFKLIKGNPHTALDEILNVVFSESAVKNTGNTDPVGQTFC
jgi:putative ABC transport system permease protein